MLRYAIYRLLAGWMRITMWSQGYNPGRLVIRNRERIHRFGRWETYYKVGFVKFGTVTYVKTVDFCLLFRPYNILIGFHVGQRRYYVTEIQPDEFDFVMPQMPKLVLTPASPPPTLV